MNSYRMSDESVQPMTNRAQYIEDRASLSASPTAHVLFLSSSLLTQRMLMYSSLMDRMSSSEVRVWTSGLSQFVGRVGASDIPFNPMPTIRPFPEFPYTYLRRLNDFAWDARLRSPSRISMMKHVRSKELNPLMAALRAPASIIATLGLEEKYEAWLEKFLLSFERSAEATKSILDNRPTVVVTTGPQRYEEPAIVGSVKRLGIPTLALITSWDNITTKNRMPFRHDGYLVWSEQMKEELLHHYPYTRSRPIYVIGAPQFDVFFQDRFRENRSAFCARFGLRPDIPIILYALGSPNFLREHYGAVALAERLQKGALGDVQLLVRPHPLFDNGEEARAFDVFGDRVRVQRTGNAGLSTAARSQSEADIIDWVNSFRHADVVVNLSSTATIDAAICDRPVVNLDYDPQPGQPNAALVHDVNHAWTHFKPIAESGGVRLVRSLDEMIDAIRHYLVRPKSDSEERRRIARHVCGCVDGRSGERLADAVFDFLDRYDSGEATL